MNCLTSVLKFAAPLSAVFTFAAVAAGQAAVLTSNSVIGLETPARWADSASSMPSGFRVSSTNERTQGSAAYAFAHSPKTIAPGV